MHRTQTSEAAIMTVQTGDFVVAYDTNRYGVRSMMCGMVYRVSMIDGQPCAFIRNTTDRPGWNITACRDVSKCKVLIRFGKREAPPDAYLHITLNNQPTESTP